MDQKADTPTPSRGSTKPKKLTDAQVRTLAIRQLDRALKYESETLEPDRLLAEQMYSGRDPKLPAIVGRSSYQSRVSRDTIHAILPSLMRVFFGSDVVAEYVPVGPADVDTAKKATVAAAYVLRRNMGFNVLYTAFLDALKLKTGTVKAWWSEDKRTETSSYEGLTEDEFGALMQSDDPKVEVELVEYAARPDPAAAPPEGAPPPDPTQPPQPPPPPAQLIDCTVRVTRTTGRIKLDALPPEQRLIDPDARVYYDARFYGNRVIRTLGELVADGYAWKEVSDLSGTDGYDQESEKQARDPGKENTAEESDDDIDPTARKVIYYELYMYADRNGDGVPEYLRVCLGGDQRKLLHVDEWQDGFCFAEFCPDPRPHVATGQSTTDLLVDVQRVDSQLVRGSLDSLAQSIFPQRGYLEGEVNLDDLKSTAQGALVRCSSTPATAVHEFTREFAGGKVLPMMERFDQIREGRTGISAASRGLDPDALQSTTAAAVTATVTAAQTQLEMVARLFAENGMKQLFRVILGLLVRHHDYAETVMLPGGEWFEIDPREWNPDMDVAINTGLGRGTDTEKMAAMAAVSADQEKILTGMGPENALVTPQEIYNAEKRKLEIAGIMDVHNYFKNPATQPPKEQPPEKPDPATLLAQAELEKARADIKMAEAKTMQVQVDARINAFKAMSEAENDKDKLILDTILAAAKLEAETGTQMDVERLYAEVERDRDYRGFVVSMLKALAPEIQVPGAEGAGGPPGAPPQGPPGPPQGGPMPGPMG